MSQEEALGAQDIIDENDLEKGIVRQFIPLSRDRNTQSQKKEIN